MTAGLTTLYKHFSCHTLEILLDRAANKTLKDYSKLCFCWAYIATHRHWKKGKKTHYYHHYHYCTVLQMFLHWLMLLAISKSLIFRNLCTLLTYRQPSSPSFIIHIKNQERELFVKNADQKGLGNWKQRICLLLLRSASHLANLGTYVQSASTFVPLSRQWRETSLCSEGSSVFPRAEWPLKVSTFSSWLWSHQTQQLNF